MTLAEKITPLPPASPSRLRRVLGIVLPIVFMAAAALLLWSKLDEYRLEDLVRELETMSRSRMLAAAGVALLAYLGMTGYDWLAFRYIARPMPIRAIATTAFISYAVSYNLGHTLITGGSVRYRLYGAWGLSALDVTRVVAFCVFSFWVGACAISGVVLLLEPQAIATALSVPQDIVRPAGALLLALILTYLLCAALRRRPVSLRGWSFPVPALTLAIGQVAVTCIELTLAGTVLYVLLPSSLGLSFPAVIGIFLVSAIIGLASQVPGGLGVFETAFVHLLPSDVPSGAVLGSLLAYRGVFFLFPLGVAALMMAGYEASQYSRRAPHLRDELVGWLSSLVPPTLAFLMFAVGALLLLSNAAPLAARLDWLSGFVPASVVHASHFLGGVAGVVLLLLAYGVQRRLDMAYWLSVAMLISGALFSVLKGFHYELALALLITAAVLLPCHREFYRKSAFFKEPFTPAWLVAIAVVVLCSAWLGLF